MNIAASLKFNVNLLSSDFRKSYNNILKLYYNFQIIFKKLSSFKTVSRKAYILTQFNNPLPRLFCTDKFDYNERGKKVYETVDNGRDEGGEETLRRDDVEIFIAEAITFYRAFNFTVVRSFFPFTMKTN